MSTDQCIFCKLASGQIPAKTVFEDELAFAFHDLNPEAPIHILVIPKAHLDNINAASDEHRELLGHLLLTAKKVAGLSNIVDSGYRIVINSGGHGGQSVGHLHLHVMGGRQMTWPPG